MTLRFASLVAATLMLPVAACNDRASVRASSALPAQHIDSIVPREISLAHFRRPLGAPPTQLSTTIVSRDALVAAYVARLAKADTTALAALALTTAEFAWLYYPSNPIGLPPYDLSAGLMWFRLESNSRKGLLHALEERGNRNLHVVGYRCANTVVEGENRVHLQCALRRLQAPGDTLDEVLFGPIIERNGRFKLLGFMNGL